MKTIGCVNSGILLAVLGLATGYPVQAADTSSNVPPGPSAGAPAASQPTAPPADPPPSPPPGPEVQTAAATSARGPLVQVHASDQALEDVARDLGTQAKTTILVEPGIAQRVSASLPARPLEDALGVIVNDKDLVWGHVDLALPKDAPLPADSLFNMVRALSALGPARIAVRLAGSAEPVSLTHAGLPATPAGSADESRRSVYVIARRRVEAAAPASALPASEGTAGSSTSESVNRVTALSRQRYDLLQQLSPAERQQAIQQDLLYMMQLPPQARMQMLMDQRQAMQSLPPDVRQQLRQTMRDTWQQMGGGRGRRLNGGAGPAPVPMPG